MTSKEIRPAGSPNLLTAEVVIPRRLDKALHYSIPERLRGRLSPGVRLLVPLGRFKITGYLVGFSELEMPEDLKEVIDLLDDRPIINDEILNLARWASEYFIQPFGLMIKAAIPGGEDLKSKHYFRLIDQGISADKSSNSLRGRALSTLKKKADWISISELSKEVCMKTEADRLSQILSRMRKSGILEEEIRIVGRKSRLRPRLRLRRGEEDLPQPQPSSPNLPQLQRGEADLINEIKDLIDKGVYSPYLLAGMNKAARERIYPHLISACIDKGRGVLLLVPEISPNLGLVKILEGKFSSRMSLFHSRMSEKRRLYAFSQIREGKIDIVVGARSAVFAPIDRLGIIIVEDEDDPSYKQDKGVRYNAKTVALKRGERLNIPVIMASSAPSVEGFYYGMTGVYRLRTLPEEEGPRGQGFEGLTPRPLIKIVDMRDFKDRSILSDQLRGSAADKIAEGERVLLFVNKRGFSNSIICQDCGYYFRCPHCALSMTYHKGARRLSCRYCNKSADAPERCPKCGSYGLVEVGIGTERVEEEIQRIFPDVRQIRLDRDTIKGSKGQRVEPSSPRALRHVNGEAKEGEIVIGTDIVMRIPGIRPFALIGIVSADTGLHLPDFRLSHRTYKLLRGLIDLAGGGEVIIQTRNPYHHAIQAHANAEGIADPANRGLDRFYSKEIGYRRELKYPPFSSMIIITIEGSNSDKCLDRSLRLAKIIRGSLGNGIELLGPARGYPEMIRGRHRWQMVLKGERPVQDIIKRSIEQLKREVSTSGVRIDLDMDP